jgi:hypothetical protein
MAGGRPAGAPAAVRVTIRVVLDNGLALISALKSGPDPWPRRGHGITPGGRPVSRSSSGPFS